MSSPVTRLRRVLVAGATGFVGRALVPALVERGHLVRACARRVVGREPTERLEYVRCDLLDPGSMPRVLEGVDAAYYLVHSLGSHDFRELDRRAARTFAKAAEQAGVQRIVYLGGVAPKGEPSEHLASRMEVGRILREGAVPTLELRAAMIVGPGSASWQIVRDLALRLPAMVFPSWLSSRLSPIALDDVVQALADALQIELAHSAIYDLPGPELLTGKEILERVAALQGRRLPSVSLPWLTPRLSSLWLKLVTRADFQIARELVDGLTGDLVPEGGAYWDLTGHPPRRSFEQAAREAIAHEGRTGQRLSSIEEQLVRRFAPRLRTS